MGAGEGGFAPGERALLAGFWHPIAYATEIADRPFAATLLDEPLVAFRSGGGITVARDRCPHRGSALSLGRMAGDEIVCAYHGLRFAGDGRCTAIPSAGPDARIPPRLDLATYPVVQRYGLVWTCLAPPARAPLPEWPALEAPALQKVKLDPALWHCSALRHVENFNDIAHFAWVHGGTFGDPDDPLVAPARVSDTAHGLHREITVNQVDRDSFAKGADTVTAMTYVYDFTLPFASALQIASPDGRNEYIYDTICPVSATRSRIFILKARDYDLDQPVDDWIRFQAAVNEEDRRIVESQSPAALPLDLEAEGHIYADGWSIALRRRWRALRPGGDDGATAG
jgi:phenylpropionate dioxygenase-like ring-hydroxylating dioxygenase large terminal subunit